MRLRYWRFYILVIGAMVYGDVCWASEPAAVPPRLGVIGETAQQYLKKRNVTFDTLAADDVLDRERMRSYGSLIYQGRPNSKQLDAIRAYLASGGMLYWEYPWRSDIAGASNATGGYSTGSCVRIRAETKHPITESLAVGAWIDIQHPNPSLLKSYAAAQVLTEESDCCEVLLSAEIAGVEESESSNGKPTPKLSEKRKAYPWLTVSRYGNGTVVTGGYNLFRYVLRVENERRTVVPLDALAVNLVGFLRTRPCGTTVSTSSLKTAEIPPTKACPRQWPGLEQAATGRSPASTSCWMGASEFVSSSVEEIAAKCDAFNAKVFALFPGSECETLAQLDKFEQLRRRGYRLHIAFSGIKPASGRLPDSQPYGDFFNKVRFWSSRSDIIGCDEWFLSPVLTATQGGTVTNLDRPFLEAFKRFAGLAEDDANWAFIHWSDDDRRAVKAWEFCDKVQNDLMREFVRVAKEANPKVRTWVSYITRNWNKQVTSIDSSVAQFDEILDCQTYWYGRYSNDPLNAAKITNAIGLGKIYQCEYPDKSVWMGFGPHYAGGRPTKVEATRNFRHNSHYHNTPEEVVPYLATLYASSDGVFVFTAFNGEGAGNGSDDDYADVVRLVSRLVPRVKRYVKGNVAYHYDPQATWELVRRNVASILTKRESDRISLGFLQQFCDVDVTRNVRDYQGVVCGSQVLPSVLDLARQKVYFMYAPQFNEKAEKVPAAELAKLGFRGFLPYANANRYTLSGDVTANSVYGAYSMGITDAAKPLRTITLENKGKQERLVIAAENAAGNIRTSTLCPFVTEQDVVRKAVKKDVDAMGWTTRDCPQINGVEDNVAVSFRDPRTAVVDFGRDASYQRVHIVVFNGAQGVIRDETTPYTRGMAVSLPSLSVMVAHGIASPR